MLAKTIQAGTVPAEITYTDVKSYPSIDELASHSKRRTT